MGGLLPTGSAAHAVETDSAKLAATPNLLSLLSTAAPLRPQMVEQQQQSQPQEQEPRVSAMISPEDLVTPRDMTGIPSPSALRNTAGGNLTAQQVLNSPQRLRASTVVGAPPKAESVEVVIQGVKPYLHKSPWNPPAWSSPSKPCAGAATSARKAAIKGLEKTGSGAMLTVTQKLVASQLAGLEVTLAAELVSYADKLRLQRVRQRVERDLHVRQRPSMRGAVSLISLCRGHDPYTTIEAEDIVRARTGRTREYPLHVYGFLIHLALYPITILLALVGYFQVAISAASSVGIGSGVSEPDGKSQGSTAQAIQRIILIICTFFMILPIGLCTVVLCAVPDVVLLLIRPLLPLSMKLALLPWFFPTSIAFWSAGMCGFVPAFMANLLLGACPVGNAFLSMSFGGQLCNTKLQSLPPSSGFQAAVVCSPQFMSQQRALRATALRGIPEFYAPAGGPLAEMPFVVQWAFLLGDTELRAAWEAECMGHLPQAQHRDAAARGAFCQP